MEFITSCPICKGTIFVSFLQCKDFTASQEIFQLDKCEICQFVFTNPRPSKGDIGRYYQSDKYISHTGGKKNIIDKIYLIARRRTLKIKRQIVEQNTKGKTVLDVGCGTGEFLKELSSNGFETFGIEPSKVAREKAIQLGGGKIEERLQDIGDQKFDVITLWHVLEHLHDLNQSLNTLNTLLKKTGTIFIAVPNLKSNDAIHYQSNWAAYDVPRHLWHFSQSDMSTLLHNNGFKLVNTLPLKLDAFYVSLLSESYQNGPKFFNYLRAVFQGIKSNLLARTNSNYSSLIYIARK